MESISLLRDSHTVEHFYLQLRSMVFKVRRCIGVLSRRVRCARQQRPERSREAHLFKKIEGPLKNVSIPEKSSGPSENGPARVLRAAFHCSPFFSFSFVVTSVRYAGLKGVAGVLFHILACVFSLGRRARGPARTPPCRRSRFQSVGVN